MLNFCNYEVNAISELKTNETLLYAIFDENGYPQIRVINHQLAELSSSHTIQFGPGFETGMTETVTGRNFSKC